MNEGMNERSNEMNDIKKNESLDSMNKKNIGLVSQIVDNSAHGCTSGIDVASADSSGNVHAQHDSHLSKGRNDFEIDRRSAACTMIIVTFWRAKW